MYAAATGVMYASVVRACFKCCIMYAWCMTYKYATCILDLRTAACYISTTDSRECTEEVQTTPSQQ